MLNFQIDLCFVDSDLRGRVMVLNLPERELPLPSIGLLSKELPGRARGALGRMSQGREWCGTACDRLRLIKPRPPACYRRFKDLPVAANGSVVRSQRLLSYCSSAAPRTRRRSSSPGMPTRKPIWLDIASTTGPPQAFIRTTS